MRKYETIIVIDSLLKSEEIKNIISRYERFISANGGIIESTQLWGKRRLAYEIKKRQYGFYVIIRFEAPPAMIKQLDREYRLNESLLRTSITKLDKKAIAAMANQPPISSSSQQAIEMIDEQPLDMDSMEEAAEQETSSEEMITNPDDNFMTSP